MPEPQHQTPMDEALAKVPWWWRFLAIIGWLVVAGVTTWISNQHGWRPVSPNHLPLLTGASGLLYFTLVLLVFWLCRRRRG